MNNILVLIESKKILRQIQFTEHKNNIEYFFLDTEIFVNSLTALLFRWIRCYFPYLFWPTTNFIFIAHFILSVGLGLQIHSYEQEARLHKE